MKSWEKVQQKQPRTPGSFTQMGRGEERRGVEEGKEGRREGGRERGGGREGGREGRREGEEEGEAGRKEEGGANGKRGRSEGGGTDSAVSNGAALGNTVATIGKPR